MTTPSNRAAQFRAGFGDALGVGIGLFPIGLTIGLLVIQAGLPWWLAPALSLTVFAGASELLMVSMISTATPLLTIAVTVFAINFRHVFYPLSFPVHIVKSRIGRAYSIHTMIDAAYAKYASMPAEQLSSTRMLTGQALMQAFWLAGSLLGVAVASMLPEPIKGLEFALVALFTALALDSARSRREVPSVVLAGLSVGVAVLAFPDAALLAAVVIFSVALVARYLWIRSREADNGAAAPGERNDDSPQDGAHA